MEYDSHEHMQLLKERASWKEEKNYLETENYSKLLKYSLKVSDHIHWCQRKNYLSLIKRFVNGELDGNQ